MQLALLSVCYKSGGISKIVIWGLWLVSNQHFRCSITIVPYWYRAQFKDCYSIDIAFCGIAFIWFICEERAFFFDNFQYF